MSFGAMLAGAYAIGMVTEERGQNISDPYNWLMNIGLNLASVYLEAG